MKDEDKLKILQKIGSSEMNCLDANRKKRNKAIRIANKEILNFVAKNCHCLDHQYVPDNWDTIFNTVMKPKNRVIY